MASIAAYGSLCSGCLGGECRMTFRPMHDSHAPDLLVYPFITSPSSASAPCHRNRTSYRCDRIAWATPLADLRAEDEPPVPPAETIAGIQPPLPDQCVEVLHHAKLSLDALDPLQHVLHHRTVRHPPVVGVVQVLPVRARVPALVDVLVVIRAVRLTLGLDDLVGGLVEVHRVDQLVRHDADAFAPVAPVATHLDTCGSDGYSRERRRDTVIKTGRGADARRGRGMAIRAQRDAFGVVQPGRIHAEGV